MNYPEILKYQNTILEAVLSNRLKDSLDLIAGLKSEMVSADILERYNSIFDTYQNMLKYSFEYAPDPQREMIYTKLQQSILELADELKDRITRKNFLPEYQYYLAQNIDLKSLSDLELSQLIVNLIGETSEMEQQDVRVQPNDQNYDKTILCRRLFYTFLLTNFYRDTEKDLMTRIIDNNEINWKVKSLFISAITLSLMRHFDREKVILLFDLSQLEEAEIRQRAIIGLFFTLVIYQKRFIIYEDILNRLRSIPDNTVFQERVLSVLIQFVRTRETEKITKKIQEEIVPQVLKIKSELEDKLNLEELLSKENFEEKNPDWQNVFKDAPDVYQKLEQFSQMQTEGSDVFMGAFAMLKNFGFFGEMVNWFLPFDGENEEIGHVFENMNEDFDKHAFIQGLEKSSVLCNSDKYSFCLNIKNMPSQQSKMMLELFNMELKTMNEMAEDEQKLNVEMKNKVVNTQYLQDLYRFFKLNTHRNEYIDVFALGFDVLDSEVLKIVFENNKIIRNLAEFYFAKDQYTDAIRLFGWLNDQDKSFELLEKIGFCYQKSGNYRQAILSYNQAELFDRNKLWLQKKLGYCYRKIGDYGKAIEQYNLVIKAEPNNLSNLAYIGQLHIDCEDYDEALKYYYKVEYENPKNPKIYRPIGWCSFLLGKYDTAIKYFKKVINDKPNQSDFLNIGHCYWAAGKTGEALEAYRSALFKSKNDEKWFRESFRKDQNYLIAKSIHEFDIALMIDYVLLK